MQLFFLHFKFKCHAWFSHHHDKSPPFQSRNNHVLAQHPPTVTATVNSAQLQRVGSAQGGICAQGAQQPRTPAPHTPGPPSPGSRTVLPPAQPRSSQAHTAGSSTRLQAPRFLFSTKASSHPTLLSVMGSISNIPFLLEDCYVSLLKELKLLKPLLNFQ